MEVFLGVSGLVCRVMNFLSRGMEVSQWRSWFWAAA